MSKENFQYWKELVGLEETEFPQFIPISEENIDKASIVSTRLSQIRNAIATNNLVDIQVYPGWGATTLFKIVENDLRKDNLTLLLSFDYEKDTLNETLTEEKFVFKTKWKLANGICDIIRDKPMQQVFMYEVFDFVDDGSIPWIGYLRRKRKVLDSCYDDAKTFYNEFNFFKTNTIVDCINYFLTNFQIRSVFMYLFPSKVDEDSLLELVGMIKEKYDGQDIKPAAMREVYICTPKVFKQMKSVFSRPFHDILYKRYSGAEMFSMLVATYRNDYANFSTVNDVFDEEFITQVYDEKLTMTQIMEKVTKAIENNLEGEIADIPYKLTFLNRGEM